MRIIQRVTRQANTHVPEEEQMSISPHQLRHHFLHAVANKKSVHYAAKLSGSVGTQHVFRYVQPSDDQVDEAVEDLGF